MAVIGEEPRARALQALLGRDNLVGEQIELGLYVAVGPGDARHVGKEAVAQAEVEDRLGDGLFLIEQARPEFDFASDPERVDALVADGLGGAGPDLFPMIAFRRQAGQADGLPSLVDPHQIQVPRILNRGYGKDLRVDGGGEGMEGVLFILKPGLPARRTGSEQVEAAVVVQVCREQAHRFVHAGDAGPSGDLMHRPGRASLLIGQAQDDAVGLEHDKVDDAVAVEIGGGEGSRGAHLRRQGPRQESALSFIRKDVDRPGAVEQGGIGVAVAVEVGPDHVAQAVDLLEEGHQGEGAVAVIAEHTRRAVRCAEDEIDVAFEVEVGGPGAGVGSARDGGRQGHLAGHVGEDPEGVLLKEPQPAGAGQGQVGPEIIIIIEPGDGVGRRRLRRESAGKRIDLVAQRANLLPVGHQHRRQALAVERDGADPGPRRRVGLQQRLGDEDQRIVGGGRRRAGGREAKKALRRLAHLLDGHQHRRQILAIGRDAQEHVSQKRHLGGGALEVGGSHDLLQGVELFGGLGRPERGLIGQPRRGLPERFEVLTPGGEAGLLDEPGHVVRRYGEDQVEQGADRVVAADAALPLDLLGQRIGSLQVGRVEGDGLP